MGLLRDGKPRKVTALIAERGAEETAAAEEVIKGVEGAELTDAPDGAGVLVKSVQEGSPAAQGGLHANDVILGIGRSAVTDLKSFREGRQRRDLAGLEGTPQWRCDFNSHPVRP